MNFKYITREVAVSQRGNTVSQNIRNHIHVSC